MTVLMHVIRIAVGWHFLYEGVWKLMQGGQWSCLSYLDGAQGPLAAVFKWMGTQPWLVATGDYAVMGGLVLIGLSLITGVLARLAAFFAILLMAMFYTAQPPEPFATAMSGADGRFFLFERNAIEAMALLAIVVIPSWGGWLRSLVPGAAVLAAFGGLTWSHYRAGGFKKAEAITSATVKVHEFTALASLKAKMSEHVKIGDVEVSRLALGGDLMAGHAHARDLIWTDEFMSIYHTGGTLERTVRYCTFCGIDAVFAEPSFAVRILEHFSLDGYFDRICGASMDEKRVSKADVIRYTLETNGLVGEEAESMMIGDRCHDIAGAKETGLASLGVLWGYGSRDELAEAGADYIADDIPGMVSLIRPLAEA